MIKDFTTKSYHVEKQQKLIKAEEDENEAIMTNALSEKSRFVIKCMVIPERTQM